MGVAARCHRDCGAPLPEVPLILAAWHEAPLLMKRVRLLDQLEWAAENGILGQVDRYLRSLREQDWFPRNRSSRGRKKVSELEARLPAAMAAVTDCAAQVLAEATGLQEGLKSTRVPALLSDEVPALALTLDAEAVGALGVLKELRAATDSGYLNAAEVLRVLTEIDARLIGALAGLADLSGRLEKAAETGRAL